MKKINEAIRYGNAIFHPTKKKHEGASEPIWVLGLVALVLVIIGVATRSTTVWQNVINEVGTILTTAVDAVGDLFA